MATSVENVRAWVGLFLSLLPIINVIGSFLGFHIPAIDPSIIDGITGAGGASGVALLLGAKPIGSNSVRPV